MTPSITMASLPGRAGLAEVVSPGKTQLLDVVRVDRGQGRVVGAVLVAAAGEPVLRLRVRRLQACRIHVSCTIGRRVAERGTQQPGECGATPIYFYLQDGIS